MSKALLETHGLGWFDRCCGVYQAVLRALETAEKREKPPVTELFSDVYKEKPAHLMEQEEELRRHIQNYPNDY